VNRKEFIKTCGLMCMGGTAMLLQSCTGNNYLAKTTASGNRLALAKTEFEKTENGKTVKRNYVIVKTEQLNFPICVYRIDDATYSAVLMECTHKGCELQPHGDFLTCPCHGSEFSKLGVVQNPPAESNLKTFLITNDHETIYIQL
jgi:cytochrome b6-f complex iron-sulfur subunit